MEVKEELPPQLHSTVDCIKGLVGDEGTSTASVEVDVCQSNGVADLTDLSEAGDNVSVAPPAAELPTTDDSATATPLHDHIPPDNSELIHSTDSENLTLHEADILAAIETNAAVEHLLGTSKTEGITPEILQSSENVVYHETQVKFHSSVEVVDNVNEFGNKVTFETEILVEKNEVDTNEVVIDNSNNILCELQQDMQMEALQRSSGNIENIENNNCAVGEEVFNNEELLDILEGNDDSGNQLPEIPEISSQVGDKKLLEAEIAMKQLNKLKSLGGKKGRSGKKNTPIKKKERQRRDKIQNIITTKDISIPDEHNTSMSDDTDKLEKKNESIVNVLVKDWEDDEPSDVDQPSQVLNETGPTEQGGGDHVVQTQDAIHEEDIRKSIDSSSDNQTKRDGQDGLPQRRLGRVIKKKVPFDPDNPPTFTKSKVAVKKELQTDKEQPPLKKIKPDQAQRANSKSPVSKLQQWKKPPPKNGNSKHSRTTRLTEVDKLLMDEGAVNMIYQLTPEAPKGKKNMRTKAEFIKKVQSLTPDGKEMKFRERKTKLDDCEAKKLGGKQRSSMSSSVKSPSGCDDFEAHSADDSIIYRRHSSSSYSSSCMSPRRLSDVDPNAVGSASNSSRQASTQDQSNNADVTLNEAKDFIAEVDKTKKQTTIKDGVLTIKEQISKKISLALSKRKRNSLKTEKPAKQKRVSKTEDTYDSIVKQINLKYVSVNTDDRFIEISFVKNGPCIEVWKELQEAFIQANTIKDKSVTLLISECGILSTDLDATPLLDDNMAKRTNYAYEVAESARSLLCTMAQHSKLLMTGVWGPCSGMAVALVAVSDVALAAESATFEFANPVPMPGAAVLTTSRRLPQSLVNDLIIMRRRVSCTEAVHSGLVTRSMWPGGLQQARTLARDIASQPAQSLLLRKQLLKMRQSYDATFPSLEKERDLLVEYWTSVEGQEVLREATK